MIRQLQPGEPIPKGEPRRYRASQGYIRLRWRIGVRSYVETYEHRVIGDRVTTAPHVHHRNGDKTDNRPENLEPIDPARHGAEHRTVDRSAVVAAYQAGSSTLTIAAEYGCTPGALSRILRAEGVTMRPSKTNVPVDETRLRRLHAAGWRAPSIAADLGVGVASVRRALRDCGLTTPTGRPPRVTA